MNTDGHRWIRIGSGFGTANYETKRAAECQKVGKKCGERGVSVRGKSGAHEIFSGIGISLCAPQTPRPPEIWRVNIDDVRMEQQLLSSKVRRLCLRAPGRYFRSVGQQKVV